MLLDYITNIYILPLISSIIGLILVYLYDKYEKKQYTSSVYLRFGVLIYISTYGALYISKLNILSSDNMHSGGMVSDPQLSMPQSNDIKSHLEHFKIGIPTF